MQRLFMLAVLGPGAALAQLPPDDPAEAPPSPAMLAPLPPRATLGLPPGAANPLAGLEATAEGGWRLRLEAGTERLPGRSDAALAELGRRLAAGTTGRVTVVAQASGPVADVSSARRRSLAHAEAVKRALVAGGLDPTRVDLRPLGRTSEALDAVDVQPPPARKAG